MLGYIRICRYLQNNDKVHIILPCEHLAIIEGFSDFGGKKKRGFILRVALFGGPIKGGFITKMEKNLGEMFGLIWRLALFGGWPCLRGLYLRSSAVPQKKIS